MANCKMNTEIPFYNILNVFFVGVIAVILYGYIFPTEMKYVLGSIDNYAAGSVGVYALPYFIGLVISRVGSIVVEPIVKWLKLIPWVEYEIYCKAEQDDKMLRTLAREYALSRNFATLFLSLFVASPIARHWTFLVVAILMTALFSYSMQKYAKEMSSRCNAEKSPKILPPARARDSKD
jgi:hypothetical protein